MKLNDDLHILEVPMPLGDPVRIMNVSVIVDRTHGLTLVDTGLPNQADLIERLIAAEGLSLAEIKQIVLTHQDLDHVGSLHPLKQRTGANVVAYVDEVPYIDGTLPIIKYPSAERQAQNPGMTELLKHYHPTPVDQPVQDGERLPLSAGAIVIATPGHTPGHMSLYFPKTKTLLAGDSLMAENGILTGPMPGATPNMELAMQSVKKFLDFDIETIVCYHGGLVTDDAPGQLKRVTS
jgi:glyoxylase-like metal-dependent hydrolase (beta-lactamase superfamily II)